MAKNKIKIIVFLWRLSEEKNIFTIEWTIGKRVKIDKIQLYTFYIQFIYIHLHPYAYIYLNIHTHMQTYIYIYKCVSKTVQIYKLRLS